MTKKISSLKTKKIVQLHLEGYNESAIAKKLQVNQSTVSRYIGQFNAICEQKGMEAALLAYDVEYDPDENQTIVEEFKNSGLTIADVHISLQVDKELQACGIDREEYHGYIQTIKKMTHAPFFDAAEELNFLEEETGYSFEDIVDEAKKKSAQLEKDIKELTKTQAAIQKAQEDLVQINKAKNKASDELKYQMKKTAVDMERLEEIEPLAKALNAAGIPDSKLPEYVMRQEYLDKTGITIDMFSQILKAAKTPTDGDNGALLLNRLLEYGGLVKAISSAQVKKTQLDKEVVGLEEKKQLNAKLENENKKLNADNSKLKAQFDRLQQENISLSGVSGKLNVAEAQLAEMNSKISQKQTQIETLDKEIALKQQKVGDLAQVESKRDELLHLNAEVEEKMEKDKRRWEIFQACLGLLQQSTSGLEKFAKALPALIEEVKSGKFSPALLTNAVLSNLTGGKLEEVISASQPALPAADPAEILKSLLFPGQAAVVIEKTITPQTKSGTPPKDQDKP